MEKEISEDQVHFAYKIKALLHPKINYSDTSTAQAQQSNNSNKGNIYSQETDTETSSQLKELIKRIENLEQKFEETQLPESPRKSKIKDQITALLEEHKKLSSSQLSKLLGLSRTRCNEYFRDLTKEGITEGILIDRNKFYKLVKK